MSDERLDTAPLVQRLQRVRGDDDALDDAVRLARLRAQLFDRRDSPVRVARFTLVRPLGKGGMGTVYEAYDSELDRGVAIKLVRMRGDADDARLHEGRALARLVHPNVVTVYEVGIHEGEAFVVMELVRGPNLRAWMESAGERRRSWPEVVGVFVAAANGLAAAHAAGVRHGDVKPDNIVLGADGRTRVVDFGIAAMTAPGARDVTRGGTPGYMAPEQSASSEVDPRSDQYGLGIALYEVLHGRRPDSSPPRFDATVPRWLARIIVRATAPDPGERFPAMDALADALSRGLRSRRLRRGLPLALGVAVVAGGVGFATLPSDPCAAIPPLVVDDADDARLREHVAKIGVAAQQVCRWEHGPPAERPVLLEARRACLDDAESMTRVALDWHVRNPDAALVWSYALDGLEDAARCDEPDTLRARGEPVARGDGEFEWALALAAAQAEAGFAAAALDRIAALRARGDLSARQDGLLRLRSARIALEDDRPTASAEIEAALWSTIAGRDAFAAVQAATLLARVIAERADEAAAARWFALATAMLEGVGDPPRLRAELELVRAAALAREGRDAEAERALSAAAAATDPDDARASIALLTRRAHVRFVQRRWTDARTDYAGALTLRRRQDEDHPAALLLQLYVSITLVGDGREDEALAAIDEVLAEMDARLGPTHGWTLRARRTRCLALGQREGPAAEEPCQRELGLAFARAGMPGSAASVDIDRADLLSLLGRYDEAAALLREALASGEQGRPTLQIVATLARVEALAGRSDVGLRLLEERLAGAETRSHSADVARLTEIDLLLDAGRVDDAATAMDRALADATSDPIAFVARRGMVEAARGHTLAALADLETGALMSTTELDVLGPVTQRLAELRARLDPRDPRIHELAAAALRLYDFAPGRAGRAAALRAWLAELPAPRP